MGSRAGVEKMTATRLGLPVEEFRRRNAGGLKFCWRCREWKPREMFSSDRTRGDGLKSVCQPCDHVLIRRSQRLSRPDVKTGNRASEAVRQAIRRGDLCPVDECACVACGLPAQDYHHHLGYEDSHLLDVVPLCKSCHRKEHWNG